MNVIIVVPHGAPDGENDLYYGPFATDSNGTDACDWAFNNLPNGIDWYWAELSAPKLKD